MFPHDKRRKSACKECERLKHGQMRQRIIETLGSQCARCGEDDPLVLQIDHVNDDGAEERKRFGHRGSGRRYMQHLLAEVLSGSDRYAILCANCNMRKEQLRRREIEE